MSAISIPPGSIPWPEDRELSRRQMLLVSAAGLFTFAAVGQMAAPSIDCSREPILLTGADSLVLRRPDSSLVAAKEKHHECEAPFGTIGYDADSGLQVKATLLH